MLRSKKRDFGTQIALLHIVLIHFYVPSYFYYKCIYFIGPTGSTTAVTRGRKLYCVFATPVALAVVRSYDIAVTTSLQDFLSL